MTNNNNGNGNAVISVWHFLGSQILLFIAVVTLGRLFLLDLDDKYYSKTRGDMLEQSLIKLTSITDYLVDYTNKHDNFDSVLLGTQVKQGVAVDPGYSKKVYITDLKNEIEKMSLRNK